MKNILNKFFKKYLPKAKEISALPTITLEKVNKYDGKMYHEGLEYFDLHGENWLGNDSDKPIAIMIHFMPWKRQYMQSFLPEYRLAFARPKTQFVKVKESLDKFDKLVFIVWGMNDKPNYTSYAESRNIPIYRMEDGFLRSVSLGAAHSQPLSLILDKRAIYFNSNQESDIEYFVNNSLDIFKDENILRSRKCIELLKKFQLSKYNDDNSKLELPDNNGKERVLVIGQVDDDASLKFGCKVKITSNELVRIAKENNPNAEILYKPHPEVLAGFKPTQEDYRLVSDVATIVADKVSIDDVLSSVDKVYVITSLVGFEAILRNIPVFTYGVPFYAGYGLTIDQCQIPLRRIRKLTVEQLFYVAYIKYPRYVCPITKRQMSVEQAIFTLVILKSKTFESSLYNEFESKAGLINLTQTLPSEICQEIISNDEFLGINEFGKFLAILAQNTWDKDNLEHLSKLISYTTKIEIMALLAIKLKYYALYDELKSVIVYYSNWFSKTQKMLPDKEKLLFFQTCYFSISNLKKCRIVEEIPLLSVSHEELSNTPIYLIDYLKCLISNTEYERAYDLLLQLHNQSYSFWFKLVGFFNGGIFRTERDGYKKHFIKTYCAKQGLDHLNKLDSTRFGLILNKIGFLAVLNALDDLIPIVKIFGEELKISKIKLKTKTVRELAFPAIICLLRGGQFELARTIFEPFQIQFSPAQKNSCNSFFEQSTTIVQWTFKDFLKIGVFNGALGLIQLEKNKLNNSISKNTSLAQQLERVGFLETASNIMNSIPQPRYMKGVVILATLNCLNSLAMLAPSVIELKKMGFVVISLVDSFIEAQYTSISSVNSLINSVNSAVTDNKILEEWHIDWDARQVISHGINFYQGIYECLSNTYRKFHIDINDPATAPVFDSCLKKCDYILRTCLKIEQLLLIEEKLPVVIISGNSHVSPYSTFRDFALARNNENLRFVATNVAYENYYTNLGKKYSSSMAVVDMTLHRKCRAPFLAIKERFEHWYSKEGDNEVIAQKVSNLLYANRSLKTESVNKKDTQIQQQIEDAKARGKKIICCFGKILCDLGVPYDGGAGHSDIVDWINHTVQIADKHRDDVLLLIKPHPHELRPEIARDLVETLRGVLPQDLPDNVIFLEHNSFNVHELASIIDLAILWNGTSSLELTILGIPTTMCSYFGEFDYPVELIYPKSREHYADLMLNNSIEKPSLELQKKAAALLYYMGTTEVAIPNTYSMRPITNDSIGIPKWIDDKVADLLINGDPFMKIIADRILEGVEPANFNS